MTFGNLKSLDERRLQDEFEDAHATCDCKGTWKVTTRENIPHTIEGLGMVILVKAPFVECDTCEALYFYPGLEQNLRLGIATQLINDAHALDKRQLRFLRIVAGMTQQETASALNMDVKEYNKFESVNNTTRHLSIDRQFRLRVIYARRLGLDLNELARIADHLDPDQTVHLPQRIDGNDLLNRLAL
jgi:transcriptional regulator with XRE-family HTH domain